MTRHASTQPPVDKNPQQYGPLLKLLKALIQLFEPAINKREEINMACDTPNKLQVFVPTLLAWSNNLCL